MRIISHKSSGGQSLIVSNTRVVEGPSETVKMGKPLWRESQRCGKAMVALERRVLYA